MEKDGEPLKQISARFGYNLARVSNLLDIHDRISADTSFSDVYKSDILRSGVVFLHAAMEDVFRQLIKYRSSKDISIVSAKLKFPIGKDDNRFPDSLKMADLIKFRGQKIDDIIYTSVDHYLDHMTLSRRKQLEDAIAVVGLSIEDHVKSSDTIMEAIKRRHRIVHEGDRKPHSTTSHGRPRKIMRKELNTWLEEVEKLGKTALTANGALASWIYAEE